jgi:hypothetical protein
MSFLRFMQYEQSAYSKGINIFEYLLSANTGPSRILSKAVGHYMGRLLETGLLRRLNCCA